MLRHAAAAAAVVDPDDDRPLAPARVFHYEHPAVDGRNVLLVVGAARRAATTGSPPTAAQPRYYKLNVSLAP